MVTFLLLLFSATANADSPVPSPWRVVLLYGTDYMLPTVALHNRAMREVLDASTGRSIDIYSDGVDAQRFRENEFEAEFLALMRKKYAGSRVDLVVAANSFALNFAERHRNELWPGARILYVNIPEQLARGHKGMPGDLGIPIRFDFDGTIDLARRLTPAARRIVVFGGVSDLDRKWRQAAVDAAKRSMPGLAVEDLEDGSLSDMLDAVRQLPQDAIVYYVTMFRDAAGNSYIPRDVSYRLALASPVPVFSHFGSYLGTGIVGGALTDDVAEGRRVGEMILAMLSGNGIFGGPQLTPIAGVCAVDHRALERFDLDASALPAGCAVTFRPVTPWEAYRGYIVAGLAIIVLQSGLIAALVVQLRRRKRAELEVAGQREELSHAARLATLGELTASISHEVNQPLGAILSNAEAAEMLLDEKIPRLDLVREILADIRRDDARASDAVKSVRDLLKRQGPARSPLDLDDVVADCVRLVGSEARRRGIAMHALASRRPACILGDRVQLRQALINLLINALDALSDKGLDRRRIDVRTRVAAHAVMLQVSDTGPGIAPGQLPKLFNAFFTTKPNGTGLGLSLVRAIIETHGGRIRARNGRRGGAVFFLVLPTIDLPTPVAPIEAIVSPALIPMLHTPAIAPK